MRILKNIGAIFALLVFFGIIRLIARVVFMVDMPNMSNIPIELIVLPLAIIAICWGVWKIKREGKFNES